MFKITLKKIYPQFTQNGPVKAQFLGPQENCDLIN